MIFLLIASLVFTSCGQNETKQKELELKEKELPLKEQELNLKEKDKNSLKTVSINDTPQVSFKSYAPCTFSIRLPSNFKLQPMYDDKSPDYCDYSVKTKDGFEVMQLHTLLSSRFSGCDQWNENLSEIKNLYQCALSAYKLDISYKAQKGNWFVISGTEKNGDIVYWKRVAGNSFIGDLYIKYPKGREPEIATYISTISNSFTCQ
jgi:hypothetical protein